MTAWMLSARRQRGLPLFILCLALALGGASGCSGFRSTVAKKHLPHPGIVDLEQPRELQMVSMPPYVVEPPDELEISVKPAVPDLPTNNLVVSADGLIDLGFAGDVYVAGLTLEQIEQKISLQLTATTTNGAKPTQYKTSVRLASGSLSKSYYVIGAVNTQGKFPITGNDLVIDAILAAGLRSNSFPDKAYLVRPHPVGGPDQVLKIDWVGITDRGDTATNYQLFPGDRVIVPGGPPPGLLGSLLGR